MPYKVAIRNNETKEIRFEVMERDWFKNGPEGDYYWWTEGNFSCDCNRRMSFNRAAGMTGEEVWAIEDQIEKSEFGSCSFGLFKALYAELPDGTKIKLDEE